MSKQALIMAAVLAVGAASAQAAELKSDTQKFSYALGFQLGNTIKREAGDVDVKVISEAIADVLAGKQPQLSMDDMQAAFNKRRDEQQASRKADGEKNLKAGEEFLKANKKKSGITETASGIQYKVIKAGDGKQPGPTDTVSVHYTGTLIDGKEFDSSVKRGKPVSFALNRVIKGWQEILPMMKVGSKWQVFIPAKLAYGEAGAGDIIGPNSTLVFDIELLEIQAAGPGAVPMPPAH